MSMACFPYTAQGRRMSPENITRTPSFTSLHKAPTPHTPVVPNAAHPFQTQLANVEPIVPGTILEDPERGAQANESSVSF